MEPPVSMDERECDSLDGRHSEASQQKEAHDNHEKLQKQPSSPAPCKEQETEQQRSQADDKGATPRNPDFVKECCNEENLRQLQEVGISTLRAEKALFRTRVGTGKGEGTLDAALEWLEQHDQDSDIDEPISEKEMPQVKVPLNEEEAQRRAYELQKKIREERIEREKKEALERERLRLAQTKAMLEQNAKLEEEQRKRQLALLQKEKEDHKRERERQRQLLRQEYRERFGSEMPEDAASEETQAARLQKMSNKEKVVYWCNYMNRKYKKDQRDALRACLNTIRVYCANARDHPLETKYRKIRKQNTVFQSKVVPIDGALQLLEACDFHDTGDFVEMRGPPDGFVLAETLKFIDVLLQQLQ